MNDAMKRGTEVDLAFKIATEAATAVARVKNIEIARLKTQLARERWEHASLQMSYFNLKLAEAIRISETGQ